MTRMTILLCGLGLLTACGTEEGTETTTSTSTTTSSFMPQEGWWTVGFLAEIEDDCNMMDDSKEELFGIELLLINDTDFHFIDEDGEVDNCTLSWVGADLTFDCGTTAEEVADLSKHGLDALVTGEYSLMGTFESSTDGIAEMNITIDCEGDDCGFVAKKFGDLPCMGISEYGLTAD